MISIALDIIAFVIIGWFAATVLAGIFYMLCVLWVRIGRSKKQPSRS